MTRTAKDCFPLPNRGTRPSRRRTSLHSARCADGDRTHSNHWPAVQATVTPFAAEVLPRIFKEAGCNILVLAQERTFWEKATASR